MALWLNFAKAAERGRSPKDKRGRNSQIKKSAAVGTAADEVRWVVTSVTFAVQNREARFTPRRVVGTP